MLRLKSRKIPALLITLCMLINLTGQAVYAQNSEAADPMTFDSATEGGGNSQLTAEATQTVTGSAITYYVGGNNAKEDGTGSTEAPFTTLKKAADVINNDADGGSYQIIMLGNTAESAQVVFGNGSAGSYDVTICNAVSGSAVTISRTFTDGAMIDIKSDAELTIEGSSASVSPELIFDGGGESYSSSYALFYIDSGTLIMDAGSAIQNNIATVNYADGAGVYNCGTFIMNGGIISNNKAGHSGGGVYNASVFTMNGGSITNNEAVYSGGVSNFKDFVMNGDAEITSNHGCYCIENIESSGSIAINGGMITQNICSTAAVYNIGCLDMTGGEVSGNNTAADKGCYGVFSNGGSFHLKGGVIENNTGSGVIISLGGALDMEGGIIRNNGFSEVSVDSGSNFDMSGGEISYIGDHAIAIDAQNSISISGSAAITGKNNGIADIWIWNNSEDFTVDIHGPLSNLNTLVIKPMNYKGGKQVLSGDLSAQTLSKFTLENTNYSIDSTGKMYYSGAPVTLYVNKDGSNDESTSGSSTEPLATIQEAVQRIDSSHGIIILQSDLDITDTIVINSDITIKSDEQTRTLHQKISDSGFGCMFFVDSASLSLGDGEQTLGKLVIENDLNNITKLIRNFNNSITNLYKGAVIQDGNFSDGTVYNEKNTSVFNMDGGTISGNLRIAVNNAGGTVYMKAGTISGAATDSGMVTGFDNAGIRNIGLLYLSGGTISNNTVGIDNKGQLVLSGNAYVPVGENHRNCVYLDQNSTIELEDGLNLNKDIQITVSLNEYRCGIMILSGNPDTIMQNHDCILLANDSYGVTAEGKVEYIGDPVICYVNQDYAGGDSDGSLAKPFTDLNSAINMINDNAPIGIIYLCSDLVLNTCVNIQGNITLLNNGNPHTISRCTESEQEYTYEMFEVNYGAVLNMGTAGSGDDASPTLILNGSSDEGVEADSGIICNSGTLNLYSGVELCNNKVTGSFGAAVHNNGDFNMYSGVITANEGDNYGGICNYGKFTMYGGTISNNTAGVKGGGVMNDYDSTFHMLGGEIENNSAVLGGGIYNLGFFDISGNASVPAGAGIQNDLYMDENTVVTIGSKLTGDDKILIRLNKYTPGKLVVTGDSSILQDSVGAFALEPSVAGNYKLVNNGTLNYIGEALNYYVDAGNTDTNPDGSREHPFTALEDGIAAIEGNTGVGTIHICSDLNLTKSVIINQTITLVNEGNPHTLKRSPAFTDYSGELSVNDYGLIIVLGKLILGKSEADGTEDTIQLAIDGNEEMVSNGAVISNYGILELHGGVALQNNHSESNTENDYNTGGVFNKGSFGMYGGCIRNNYGSSVGGIYNYMAADFTLYGGSIAENKGINGGGICCDSSNITVSGGNIKNNKANYGGGIHLICSIAKISGGSISGNTALDSDVQGIGKGIMVDWQSTLTLLEDAAIADNNEIFLCREQRVYGDYNAVLAVAGPLSENIPHILLQTGNLDDNYALVYHTGEHVIQAGDGYALRKQDLSKFTLSDNTYAISTSGTIVPALQESWVMPENLDQIYNYTGNEMKPSVSVKDGTEALTEGEDYQVSYLNNINAGTAEIIAEGIGNYGGTIIKTFTIQQAAVQNIITTPPADLTFKASDNKSEAELGLSIPLKFASVGLGGATAILPVTWTLTGGSFSPKGGTYTFTGTLIGDNNIAAGDHKLTARITVTPVELSKPAFDNVNIPAGTDSKADALKLGSKILPTGGTIQADNTSIHYIIDWDASTLDSTTVGVSHTFTGTVKYTDAPAWATLPTDITVTRTVSVAAAPTPVQAPSTSKDSHTDANTEKSLLMKPIGEDGVLHASMNISMETLLELADSDQPSPSEESGIKIPVSSEALIGLLQKDGATKADIDITLPDSLLDNKNTAEYNLELDKDILKAAQETKKDVTVAVKDEEGRNRYSWTFKGADLAASDKNISDIDLSLKVEKADSNTELAKLLNSQEQSGMDSSSSLVIEFSHHGELPSQASVKIYVGNLGFAQGQNLYLYYYNTESGKLESLPYSTNYKVDSDGYVTVDILHCSNYVFLPKKAASSMITSLLNQISVTPDKIILYPGKAVYGTAAISISLPDTLKLVNDLENETVGSAVGTVVVSYQSSNKKIATVNSTGIITAKGVGKTVITATVTLYSGKTKTFKINVTVKQPCITLTDSTDTMKDGESFTFAAKAYGLDTDDIVWTTVRSSVVVIDKKTGKAVAKSKGTDYVKATVNKISVKVKVTVK